MRSSLADVLDPGRAACFFSGGNVAFLSDSNFRREVYVLLSFFILKGIKLKHKCNLFYPVKPFAASPIS
jgi:hypothetical protein